MDVLVITDDDARGSLLGACLREDGYQVAHSRCSAELNPPAGGIAPLQAPAMSGMVLFDATGGRAADVAVMRSRFSGPLVVVSADLGDDAELAALEDGADDFLHTPLDPRVLRARVRRLLRPQLPRVVGGIVVDRVRRAVTASGRRLPLTDIEVELVWALASRTGEVVTREHMYRDILKTTYDGHDRGLDIHISRLRPKLSPYGVSIHAVRGSGYILSA